MTYNPVPATQVSTWLKDYVHLRDNDLPQANGAGEQENVRSQMESLATRIQKRAKTDMVRVHGYYAQHMGVVDNLVVLANTVIKNARADAAKYRKNPALNTLPPKLNQAVQQLTQAVTALDNDSNDFGKAWLQYRGLDLDAIPEGYRRDFNAVRSQIMNDSKIINSKRETILAAKHEAEGLVQIAGKATMKAGIKAGTGAQRPIAAAQQEARALAQQAQTLYDLIVNPDNYSVPPRTIQVSANSLETNAKLKTWYQASNNLELSRGQWKNVEAGYKNLTVKTAGLEKVVATKTRAFRSNELSDPTVKAEVAKAATNVKDAKKLVSDHKANYDKAKKALAKIEAGFKKK